MALTTVAAVRTRSALLAFLTLLSSLAILACLAVVPLVIGRTFSLGIDHVLIAVILVEIIAALAALILEPGAALAQHAEVVIRELEIIFGLDAVASELGIARHALVLLEQLRRIAALTIVLAIARLSAKILAPLSATTAPAAALSIIDQMPTFLTQ